ncbi:cyclic nucleotide-binding domain-containing protein [Methylomarinum vadi]|uniref:cyclic nucleotide-binding domain-containing protein n=1 Tax=Methylomarinum vadi TaxID=438855 RepID=UPI0004DFB4E0|nr:cyclic nucleotide-binding domain-containing protein [Methylomarinum vadi]
MTVDPNSEDARSIRQMFPLSRIPKARFSDICKQIDIEAKNAGEFLFRRGDSENDLIYLLDGSIRLCTEEFLVETIKSGSETAKFALAHQIPRKIDAVADTNIRFLRLNAAMIKNVQNAPYQEEVNSMVGEEPEDDNEDWMTTLLRSPIFRALPPANLQRIIMGLEEVSYERGETIIQQGDPGDYYYLIKSGQCLITRKPTPTAKEIKLAQLKSQDTFGEDSILSGEPRNVTVRAQTDVTLLRLNKENFVNLIKNPTLKYIDYKDLETETYTNAVLLDVRPPDEYKKSHLERSVNVPFFSLRMHFKTLAKKQPIIVICENGDTSNAAAFLLLRNKIEAFVLRGGMAKVPAQAKTSEATFTIDEAEQDEESASVQTVGDAYREEPSEHIEPDIEQLKQTIAQLEEKCRTLAEEKEEITRKYKLLFKQTEKMKALIDSIRNHNG